MLAKIHFCIFDRNMEEDSLVSRNYGYLTFCERGTREAALTEALQRAHRYAISVPQSTGLVSLSPRVLD